MNSGLQNVLGLGTVTTMNNGKQNIVASSQESRERIENATMSIASECTDTEKTGDNAT